MNGSRVGAIVLRILYLYRGSPQRVFPIFVFVAVDIVLWGFLTRYLNSVSRADFNFVPALLGAVLLWDFLTRVMQQLTMALFEDVWTRNFLNFFATPLRVSEYLAGLLIVAVTTSLLSLVAMLVFAQVAFGISFFVYGVALAPFLMVLFVTGIALGVTASALVLRLGPASEWLIWPIPMLISPFAGVFYPILRVRGHAGGRRRKPAAMGSFGARRRSGSDLSRPCLSLLLRRLSLGHPHRPHRPLQRRDGQLSLAPRPRR
jgi:ABC-2 type transport system permease protein